MRRSWTGRAEGTQAVTAPNTKDTVVLISTECAACAKPFSKDVDDARTGMDRACRAQFNYRHISSLSDDQRHEANAIIHGLAKKDYLRGRELRAAIHRLYELGFVELSKHLDRRLGRATVDEVEPPPLVPPPPVLRPAEPDAKPLRPLPFQPTEDQNRALDIIRPLMKVHGHAVAVVVGFAGVGKSASILFIAHEHGTPIVITPTGRAAVRVRELTGIDAMTIHSWIYKAVENPLTGVMEFTRKTPDEIEQRIPPSRLVVLDEASMVGPDVWQDVYAIVKHHGLKLVCVGDGFQLPPVLPPNVPPFSILTPEFANELGAQRVELTQVLRQAADSPVIRASIGIREGRGFAALRELPQVQPNQFWNVATETHKAQGFIVCHKNVSRFKINAGVRHMLGITDELPQLGEPLLCRRNSHSVGVMNGETFPFEGWFIEPLNHEQIFDRYKDVKESARFGAIKIGKAHATLAVEELHGKLEAGNKAIEIAAGQWARIEGLMNNEGVIPHVHAQWGYCYTAHAAQGGQAPYVLVAIEPSIRLREEEGRRWVYTAITRATTMTAVYQGNV